MLVAIAIAVAACLGGAEVRAEPDRLGAIFISGNVRTPDCSIRDTLELYPGMVLPDEATLLRIEIRLLMRFHKRFDLAAGKRPTLKVLPREGDSQFRDIEVQFPEKYLFSGSGVEKTSVFSLTRVFLCGFCARRASFP
jgi:hypothetical protein